MNDFDNDKEIQVFQESLLMTLELFDTFQSVWNDSQVIIFGSNYPVWASFNNSHHPWADNMLAAREYRELIHSSLPR